MSDNIKRVQVNFTIEQYNLLQKFKGELGNSDSEVVRNIILFWLLENSVISQVLKSKLMEDNYEK